MINNSQAKLNPITVFAIFYLIYNILGLLPYPWLIRDSYSMAIPWLAFLTGLLGLFTGHVFWRKKKVKTPKLGKEVRNEKILGYLFLSTFIACLAITIINARGVPLFQGEQRLSNSAILFNLAQVYGFWVAKLSIDEYEKKGKLPKLHISIYLIGILAFGYRSPIIIWSLIIGIYFICFKKSKTTSLKILSILGSTILIASSLFSSYRVSQDYEISSFFRNVDMEFVSNHKYTLPLVPALSMFSFSQETVSIIGNNLQKPMLGEVFLSSYNSLIPGPDWGPRNYVGDIIDARWVYGKPISITPTLQGALYIDFGLPGIFIGMFFLSGIIIILKKNADNHGSLEKLIFCYTLTLMLMSIHNGYWDITYLFFTLFIIVIYLFRKLPTKAPLNIDRHRSHSWQNN